MATYFSQHSVLASSQYGFDVNKQMIKLLVSLNLVLLIGCSNQAPIKTETSVSATAVNYSTYYWERHEQKHFMPELAKELVLKTNQVLASKGYRLTDENDADFAISFTLKPRKNEIDVTTQGNFEDYGPGVSCSGGECASTNQLHRIKERRVHINAEAFVQLTATSLKTNQQLWQAESSRQIKFDFDPDQIDQPENVKKEKRDLDRMLVKMLSPVPSINQ